MRFNPDIHHRHSIRLKKYDYSADGMYFITICTQNRAHLFGDILAGAAVGADLVSAQMVLNGAGTMTEAVFLETVELFPEIISEKHIIMPNHFHCIINILKVDTNLADTNRVNEVDANRVDTRSTPTATIGAIVQAFKSKTTVKYINGVQNGLYQPFNKRIWQRNYYEHIIRNELEYQEVCQYIDENPANWTEDCYFDG